MSIPICWHKTEKAGKQCSFGYKNRHNLSIRSLEATSVGPTTAFNKHTIKEHFEKIVVAHIGDFVVVLVSGKSRALKYIARVDDFVDEEEEYEGLFLQKVNSKITPGEDTEEPVFIVNEEDGAFCAQKHCAEASDSTCCWWII